MGWLHIRQSICLCHNGNFSRGKCRFGVVLIKIIMKNLERTHLTSLHYLKLKFDEKMFSFHDNVNF
jgi:hypothetical protein